MSDFLSAVGDARLVSDPPSLAQQIASLRRYAEKRLPTLDPGEDILPMTEFSGEGIHIPIVHPIVDDESMLSAFEGFLPKVASEVKARSWASIQQAWTLPRDAVRDEADPSFVMPRDHPNRQEIIMVTGCDGLWFHQNARLVSRNADNVAEWLEPVWSVVITSARQEFGVMVDPLNDALFFTRLARASYLTLLGGHPPGWWTPERVRAATMIDREIASGYDPKNLDAELLDANKVLEVVTYDEEGKPYLDEQVLDLAFAEDLWTREVPPMPSALDGLKNL